jgi:phosphinothricin acetyltransferase
MRGGNSLAKADHTRRAATTREEAILNPGLTVFLILSVMAISYRKPNRNDLQAIATIYNHAVRNTAATFDTEEKQPSYFEQFLAGDDIYRMMLAVIDGDVVAYAGTYPFSQRKAYAQMAELMIYVHPEWQRKGVGSALLAEIHQGAFLAGFYTVLALINKDNCHMHRAVEKEGYVYKGEMTDVACKFGERHSLVIYQRNVPTL